MITFRKLKTGEELGQTIAVTALNTNVLYFFENSNGSTGLLVKTSTHNLIAKQPIYSIKKALHALKEQLALS